MAQKTEVIRVLGTNPDSRAVHRSIAAHLDELRRSMPALRRTMVMTGDALTSDLAVVLFWEGMSEPGKTVAGRMLAEYLRQYGSVDHTAWRIIANDTAAGAGDGNPTDGERRAGKEL